MREGVRRARRDVPFAIKRLEDDEPVFEGYGSVFGTEDAYGDVIAPGAFAKSLQAWQARGKWPKMLLQHGGMTAEDLVPIGKWEEMHEDTRGLFVRGRLFALQTDRAKATYAALEAGELDGLSIGYVTRQSRRDGDVRVLTEIDLWEVSLVTFPASDPARVTDVKALPSEQEFQEWLERQLGLSRAHARCVLAQGYRALLNQVETGEADEAIGEDVIRALTALRSAWRGEGEGQ